MSNNPDNPVTPQEALNKAIKAGADAEVIARLEQRARKANDEGVVPGQNALNLLREGMRTTSGVLPGDYDHRRVMGAAQGENSQLNQVVTGFAGHRGGSGKPKK